MFLQRDAGRDGGHLSRASVASVGHTDLCPAARFNMSALSLSSSAHCLNTGQSHLETGCEIQHAQRNMRTLYSHPDWLFLHRSGFLPHTLQIRVLSTDREQRSLRLILSSVMQNGYTLKQRVLQELIITTDVCSKQITLWIFLQYCIKSQLMKMFNALSCLLLHACTYAGGTCAIKHLQSIFIIMHISNLT